MPRPNASKRKRHAWKIARKERMERMEAVSGKMPRGTRRMCYRKHRYHSELDARLKAMEIEQRRSVRLGVYRCPLCNGWHLTSKYEQTL
jgi:hypothetical protein